MHAIVNYALLGKREPFLTSTTYQLQLSIVCLLQTLSLLTRKVKVILRPTVNRPVKTQSGPVTNFSFFLKFSLDSCEFVILWHPLWREDEFVIYCCCLASPAQSLTGPRITGLETIFYWPNFCNSPNLESQVPYWHPPRTGWPVYYTSSNSHLNF
jgi:hypothetical protein